MYYDDYDQYYESSIADEILEEYTKFLYDDKEKHQCFIK